MVQVAQEAGVSISTVSHVLNGTRRVEPATRDRVLAAIEKTSYRQDTLARAMRRSRTDSIGLVVSDAGEPAFASMVHGVETAAAERGLILLLGNSAERAETESAVVDALLQRRVDGLILARCADSSRDLEQRLDSEQTPVVLLDRVFDDAGHDQVGADNRESMRRLTAHLLAQGHVRFALIAGDQRVPTLRERRGGFVDALAESTHALGDQEVIEAVDGAEVRAQLQAALQDGAITCVIACSSPLAVAALEVLRERGLGVPGDIAFATVDGFDHSDLFTPTLTTIRQPAFEMGSAAVELLIERLARPSASPRTVRLRQRLELRDSTEAYDTAQLG